MSNIKVSEFEAYRKMIIILSMTTGAWTKCNPNFIYRSLPHLHLIICLSIFMLLFRFVRSHYTNILLFTKAFSLMGSYTVISLKMICLIIYRQRLYNIQSMLDLHYNKLLQHKHLTGILLNKMKSYRFLIWGFMFFAIGSTIFQIFVPLIINILGYLNPKQPNRNLLIYPNSYPWTIPTNILYFQLHFIFESLGAISLVCISTSFEGLFTFLIFLMVGQLRDMSYNITHTKNINESEKVVKKCITQYSTLIQCCRDIEKIFGPIIIYMVVVNSMILCFLMFQIAQVKSVSASQILIMFTYFGSKFFQTLVYTWCATQLTIESEDYIKAIYAANWYENKNIMSDIIIMLQQRPLILTACGFTDISIEIFSKVINTTISYYLMLKTVESSK